MPIPLPIELRSRVVEAYNAGLGTYAELAERFCISTTSVHRWTRLDEIYNDISPKSHGGGPSLLIPDEMLPHLRALVAEKPDRSIPKLQAEWNKRHSQQVSQAVISRALLRAGLTFKKRHFDQLSVSEMMLKKKNEYF